MMLALIPFVLKLFMGSTALDNRINCESGDSVMSWTVERIINYPENQPWGQGYGHYAFHDRQGHCYVFHYFDHWMGRLGKDDEFIWTAGAKAEIKTGFHINVDFQNPIFLTEAPDGRLLVSCTGNAKIYLMDLEDRSATLFLDAQALGLKDISSTVFDRQGDLWISEITGCRIWHLDPTGHVIEILGNGQSGFQGNNISFAQAQFGWTYVMRLGPDGHLYVLDSTNFAVRRIDQDQRIVQTIVGTGKPGYSGDGGPAHLATLGSDSNEKFNGPYGLCIDERGHLYIADTYNHVIRQVDANTRIINTIAGQSSVVPHQCNNHNEQNPLCLNLAKLAALDYYNGRLFVSEWDGDLIILKRAN